MLLDLRVVLAASFAAVLLLIGGFGLLAALRTPGKPSIGLSAAPEITGSVVSRGEKSQTLTDDDKAARPQPKAEVPRSAPEPVRAVNVEKSEKIQAPQAAASAKAEKPKQAAKAKPRIRAARQNPGTNFQNNNPFGFSLFGAPTTTADE